MLIPSPKNALQTLLLVVSSSICIDRIRMQDRPLWGPWCLELLRSRKQHLKSQRQTTHCSSRCKDWVCIQLAGLAFDGDSAGAPV